MSELKLTEASARSEALAPTEALMLPEVLIPTEIEEITVLCNDEMPHINLKKPNEVYYEIYNKVKAKAKKYKIMALKAFLEAKEIKTKFMLDEFEDDEDMDDIDSDDDDDDI
jgi:hypothetical protein